MPLTQENLDQIRGNDAKMKTLDLDPSRIPWSKDSTIWVQGINHDDLELLVEALKGNTSLTSLSVGSNQIGDKGAKALAELLKENQTLTELDLRGNQIGDEGAMALAEALKSNTTLTSLFLDSNNIGHEGAMALAEALKSNTTLTSLFLDGNNIGHKGAMALAALLKENQTLTELDLSGNQIGDEVAMALAEALQSNTTLTKLRLMNNQIDDKGAVALADSLMKNKTLESLDLGWNKITPSSVQALVNTLKKNATLQSFNLFNGLIDDTKSTLIKEIGQRNTAFLFLKKAWMHTAEKNDRKSDMLGVCAIFGESIPIDVFPAVKAILRLRGIIDLNDQIIQSSNSSEGLTQYDYQKRIVAVSRELDNFFKLEYVGFDELPDMAYPKELNRLVGGKQFSLSLDSVSQMTALVLLAKPFTNEDLQKEANAELLTLLNNGFFTSLPQDSDEQKMTARLIEMVNNNNPDKSEMAGLVKQLAKAVLELPSASFKDSSSSEEEEVFEQGNQSEPTNDESTNVLRDKCFLLLQQAWEYRADKNFSDVHSVRVEQLFREKIPQEVLPAVTAILRLHGIIDSNGELIQSSNSSECLTQDDYQKRIHAVSQELDELSKLEYVGFDQLPDNAYLKELKRLVGIQDLICLTTNIERALQKMAIRGILLCLAHPFKNEDLQKEANAELLTLLNNGFFTSLPQESDEQKMTARLIEMVNNNNPDKSEMPGLVKQLATAVLNLPSASLKDSSSSEEVVDGNASPTYFQRHPNIRMGLAVAALVIGLAAIAVATVATCGVAGLLGGAAASIAATLTFGASLTTVGAVAGGVGLFGGLGVAAGSYLVHTRPGRGVVLAAQEESEDQSSTSEEDESKALFTGLRSLAVIQELEFFLTGEEVDEFGDKFNRDRDEGVNSSFFPTPIARAQVIARDFLSLFRQKNESNTSLKGGFTYEKSVTL